MFVQDVADSSENLLEILSDNSLEVYRLALEDEGEPLSRSQAIRRVRELRNDYIELYKHADGCCVDIVDPVENVVLFTVVPD